MKSKTPLYNITVAGKTDGFGCQLNAKLSGIALCVNDPKYRYVHTPFTTISHGMNNYVDEINRWMNFPYSGRRIHKTYKRIAKVHENPAHWYNNKALTELRTWFWRAPSDKTVVDIDIAVHIRRGDVYPASQAKGRKVCPVTSGRYQSNKWYNKKIPEIASNYPDSYLINIYSEGNVEDFISIADGWPLDLKQRLNFRLAPVSHSPNWSKIDEVSLCNFHNHQYNMLTAWHHLVCAKVLVQAKSGLSYTAGIYNENDVWFTPGSRSTGQRLPLNHWKIT